MFPVLDPACSRSMLQPGTARCSTAKADARNTLMYRITTTPQHYTTSLHYTTPYTVHRTAPYHAVQYSASRGTEQCIACCCLLLFLFLRATISTTCAACTCCWIATTSTFGPEPKRVQEHPGTSSSSAPREQHPSTSSSSTARPRTSYNVSVNSVTPTAA